MSGGFDVQCQKIASSMFTIKSDVRFSLIDVNWKLQTILKIETVLNL